LPFFFWGENMFRLIVFTLFFLFNGCFLGLSWAMEAPVLYITTDTQQIDLSNYVSWLEDRNHRLKIQDVIHPENNLSFQSAMGKTLNFGFSSSVYWLKIELKADALTETDLWYIQLSYPLLTNINAYIIQNNQMELLKTGIQEPLLSRFIKHPDFIFPVFMKPGKNVTVYFYIQSTSSIQLPLTLWKHSVFYENAIQHFLFIGGLYSFFILVSILNLILFVVFRYRNFLVYSFFIFSYVLFHMSYKGIAMIWLWPQWKTWGILSVPFFIALTSASSLMFTLNFLNIQEKLPKFKIIYQSAIGFCFFALFIPFILPYQYAINISIVIIIFTILFILITIVMCMLRRLVQSYFFFAAWMMVSFGTITYILKTLGFFPSTFLIERSVEIGYFLCVAMLGLSLFEQFQKELSKQKEIQEQAIVERKQRIKIKELTMKLLDRRTQELHDISTNLSQQIDHLNIESNTVAGVSEEMSTNIEAIASSVEELSVNIKGISSSSEKMSHHNTSVAGAIQELTASMNQIANHTQKGSDIAAKIVAMAIEAGKTMKGLGMAANQIGSVTEVIKRIAEKTDILAVNAAIEAASAGEAGKGFAVVAHEITKFSDQSAGAAEDIAKRITVVQEQTQRAIDVISNMQGVIESMNISSESISMAVEQQTMALHEISDNAAQANIKADEIAHVLSEMSMVSDDVSKNVTEASKGVSGIAKSIRSLSLSGQELFKISQQIENESHNILSLKFQSETDEQQVT